MTNIKQSLKEGKTPEELIEQLQNEIKQAQDALSAEEAKEKEAAAKRAHVAEVRSQAINSMLEYFKEIGLLEKDLSEKDIKEIEDILIKWEKTGIINFNHTSFPFHNLFW